MTFQAIARHYRLAVWRFYGRVFMADHCIWAVAMQVIGGGFAKPKKKIIVWYPAFEIIAGREIVISRIGISAALGTRRYRYGVLHRVRLDCCCEVTVEYCRKGHRDHPQ